MTMEVMRRAVAAGATPGGMARGVRTGRTGGGLVRTMMRTAGGAIPLALVTDVLVEGGTGVHPLQREPEETGERERKS